ncbi:class I SAM-dependent methyltransferase [Phreatobacter oligotrophus]|uniref:class I SAM-dependent methyltransferase n=1 Tax=Phreatobacter oligotrophus TaxID=1122261 RepID=UPI002355109A|nr:class I SAM-dependent methyltransferase [Phreatobacter oligotrophus]MBX9989113.1 class I SAM-dependent methyltransferase [Phreatobacter oligotrophus]
MRPRAALRHCRRGLCGGWTPSRHDRTRRAQGRQCPPPDGGVEAPSQRAGGRLERRGARHLFAFRQAAALDPALTAFERYFGGSLSDQATFDRTYETACQRFDGRSDVEIIRADTISGFAQVRDRHGDGAFDFIYVDANHQYEYVLRDLLYYQHLLSADGVMMLNDCCHSQKGMNQNLGVLEAVGNFMKRADFTPIALTSTDMSDLIIAREGSAVAKALDAAIDASDIGFVEVMPQMLPAAHIRVSPAGKTRVSFA